MTELWTNDCIDLFLQIDDVDTPLHLKLVKLQRIEWNEDIENTCVYCGGAIVFSQMGDKSTVCTDCGIIVSHSQYSLGTAYAKLVGYLPEAMTIFDIPDDATILAGTGCPGTLRSTYDPLYVILRLSHCHTVEKWMPELVAMTPDETARCTLHVRLRCEVELYPEGGIE